MKASRDRFSRSQRTRLAEADSHRVQSLTFSRNEALSQLVSARAGVADADLLAVRLGCLTAYAAEIILFCTVL